MNWNPVDFLFTSWSLICGLLGKEEGRREEGGEERTGGREGDKEGGEGREEGSTLPQLDSAESR